MCTRIRVRRTVVACALLIATGCGATVIEVGRPLRAERLERDLVLGKSTTDDVSSALGPPSGIGRSQLPTDAEPRTLWIYQYQRTTTSGEFGMSLLFVYFRDDLYDGYLWFSTAVPTAGGG